MAWKSKINCSGIDTNTAVLIKTAEVLVGFNAKRLRAEPDDLFQACMTTVPAILKSWDGVRSLATWAWRPMLKSIYAEARSQRSIVLPEARVLEICRLNKIIDQHQGLIKKLSEADSDVESILDSLEGLEETISRAQMNQEKVVSTTELISEDDDHFLDFQRISRRKIIDEALKKLCLSEKERVVFQENVIRNKSSHEVAKMTGLTAPGVRLIAQRVKDRLADRLKGKVDIDLGGDLDNFCYQAA